MAGKAETPVPESTPGGRRSVASRGGPVLIGSFAALVLAATFWSGCSTSEQAGRNIRLVIPAGAAERIAEGRPVPGIPDRIRGRVGDTLVVAYRVDSTQFVAGFPVSGGQTLRVPLNRAGRWETECSVHEDESLKMVIEPSDPS